METSPKDFFISYNSADRHWGEWIGWQLEKAGFTVSIQAWDFRPGQDFVLGMQEAVKAKHTIAVLSADYLKADFTQPEWTAAFVRDPRGNQRTLIPVLVRPCVLEGFFATRIYIDLTNIEVEDARKRLLDGIILTRAKPDTEPSFPGTPSSPANKGKKDVSLFSEHSLFLSAEPSFPKDMPPVTKAIEVFTVYSTEDKEYLLTIEKQLTLFKQQGLITTWNSSKILPGREIAPETEAHWNRSQLILLLISADSLADPTSSQMISRAVARQKAGTARVVPILLRPCLSDFDDTFVVLPANKKFVSDWNKRDKAFLDIAKGIRQVIEELLKPN